MIHSLLIDCGLFFLDNFVVPLKLCIFSLSLVSLFKDLICFFLTTTNINLHKVIGLLKPAFFFINYLLKIWLDSQFITLGTLIAVISRHQKFNTFFFFWFFFFCFIVNLGLFWGSLLFLLLQSNLSTRANY